MPHSDPKTDKFVRSNGLLTVRIQNLNELGLPFGTVPRLLMSWITTEAVRKKERRLVLGDTLSSFMGELGLVPTGGRWGSIGRVREQMGRLFGSAVSCEVKDDFASHGLISNIAKEYSLWWDPKAANQMGLWVL